MSETALPDVAAVHSPEDVRDGLARCFLRHGVDRPQWLADLAEPVVRAALEGRDAVIARLEAELRDARSGEDLSAL